MTLYQTLLFSAVLIAVFVCSCGPAPQPELMPPDAYSGASPEPPTDDAKPDKGATAKPAGDAGAAPPPDAGANSQ